MLALAACAAPHVAPPVAETAPSSGTRLPQDTIGGSPPMKMEIALYDAPLAHAADAHVNLVIMGAEAISNGMARPLAGFAAPVTVDLLALKHTPFTLGGLLPAGAYDAVRLLVDPARSNVVINGHVLPMIFVGTARRGRANPGIVGLESAVAFSGGPGAALQVAVDFNVLESIAVRGDRAFAAPKLVVAHEAAQLSGRVVNASGRPVAEATVIAFDRTSGRIANTTITEPDGSFVLHALRAGRYHVVVRNAYVTESGENVSASGASSLAGAAIDVLLAPSDRLDIGTLND